MPAPSPLAIATSSLQRLVKEEASYHMEMRLQRESIEKLESRHGPEEDELRGNRDFQLKQEVSEISDTCRSICALVVNVMAVTFTGGWG